MMHGKADGFTLIETLISLVLIGLISTLTITMFQQLQSLRTLELRYSDNSKVAGVLSYLSTEIGGALAIPLRDSGSEIQQPLIGALTSVRFVGVTREGFRTDALKEVEFSLQGEGEGKRIVRRVRSRTQDTEQTEELLKGVSHFKIEYLSLTNEREWRTDWQDKEFLPTALRMSLIYSDQAPRSQTIFLPRRYQRF